MSSRSLTLVGALVLLSWLAWAGTSRSPAVAPAEPVNARPEPAIGLSREIAREADGLWDRLRASPVPREPSRNPFTFATVAVTRPMPAAPAPAAPAPVEPPPAPVPTLEPAPPLRLQGITEDGKGDRLIRKAIVAGMGKLFIVAVGDEVTARFTVAAIGADVIELTDKAGGPPIRLALR